MFRWGLAAGQMISPSPSMMADGTWAKLKTQSSCQLNVSQRWLLSFELLPVSLWFVEVLILIICLASIWGYKKGAEHQDWHLGSDCLKRCVGGDCIQSLHRDWSQLHWLCLSLTATGWWHSYQEYHTPVFAQTEEVEIGDGLMVHPVDLQNINKHGIPSSFLNMLYFLSFHAKYGQIHPTWPQNTFLINTIKLLCILLFLSLRWIITFKSTLSYSLFCPRCQIKL